MPGHSRSTSETLVEKWNLVATFYLSGPIVKWEAEMGEFSESWQACSTENTASQRQEQFCFSSQEGEN